MKVSNFNIMLFLSSLFLACSLPAISLEAEERYDRVLAKLERIKDIQFEKEKNKEAKEKNTKENSERKQEENKKEADLTPENWILTFNHDRLPDLNGMWRLTKKTIKRKVNPVLTKPITFIHCTSRLPFEKRDFEEKDVVISLTSPDSFSVRAIYPVTDDVYHDPNQDKDIVYQNFSFKAEIRLEDITYAYTLKLKDPIDNRTLARQLWLNGKLKFEHISGSTIKAKGYEVEYTPECRGFIIDEIAFEFQKQENISGASGTGEGIVAMSFLIEQAANAAEIPGIPNENKSFPAQLDSAKDKSNFEASNNYNPVDTVENPHDNTKSTFNKQSDKEIKYSDKVKVPGMW